MFEQIDEDGNGEIDKHEWLKFWERIIRSGMPEEDLEYEVT